jgi:hypothetical protein
MFDFDPQDYGDARDLRDPRDRDEREHDYDDDALSIGSGGGSPSVEEHHDRRDRDDEWHDARERAHVPTALQVAVLRLESGMVFDAGRLKPAPTHGAEDKFQEAFKITGTEARRGSDTPHQNPDKSLKMRRWEGWYRYGDSNPGPVAENHVS